MVSGGKAYFKTYLHIEGMHGIWHHRKGDSATTDLVDSLAAELFKEEGCIFLNYSRIVAAIRSCCLNEYFPCVDMWIKTFSHIGPVRRRLLEMECTRHMARSSGSGIRELQGLISLALSFLHALVSVSPLENKGVGRLSSQYLPS